MIPKKKDDLANQVFALLTKDEPSGYSSEDDTRPNKSPVSELRSVVNAVQRGLRKERTTMEPKKDDLANRVCAHLTKDSDVGLYTV